MKLLPFNIDLETRTVLKKVAEARAALAEMKGVADSIPKRKYFDQYAGFARSEG